MDENMPVSLRIKMEYNNFSPKEKIIADYVLKNPDKISYRSISDLASSLGVANSTLFQFVKKLGYNGFTDFKMALLLQEKDISSLSIHENIADDDSDLAIAQTVFDSNIKTLSQTKQLLKEEDLTKAVDIINQSNELYLFGVGGSEVLAADAYHKFLRSPIRVRHSTDYHLQMMETALMTEKDSAICISHTGRSKETIRIAKAVHEHGAKVIVITGNPYSPLAKLGDVVFVSVSEETEFRSESLSSRISQLSILDSLFIILMFRDKTKAIQSIEAIRGTIASIKEDS